jgi:hypothetical protein
MDIPKARQYDNGKVEVIARNSAGEAYACVDLTVTGRHDDFRSVLKNSPRREWNSKYLLATLFRVRRRVFQLNLQLIRLILLMVYEFNTTKSYKCFFKYWENTLIHMKIFITMT